MASADSFAAPTAPDHYIVEVIADASGKWCGNARTFKTKHEAEVYARDLMMRWTLVTDWRVVAVRTVMIRSLDPGTGNNELGLDA